MANVGLSTIGKIAVSATGAMAVILITIGINVHNDTRQLLREIRDIDATQTVSIAQNEANIGYNTQRIIAVEDVNKELTKAINDLTVAITELRTIMKNMKDTE